MRADWVIKTIKYVAFRAEFEDVFLEINKGS